LHDITLKNVFSQFLPWPLPSLVFIWDVAAILLVLNLVRDTVINNSRNWSPTQLNNPPPPTCPHPLPATHCLYKLYFDFGKREMGGGGDPERRFEGQEFTKLGRKY
jgi:hypothetical protein